MFSSCSIKTAASVISEVLWYNIETRIFKSTYKSRVATKKWK